jgi:hypothetical protein
MRLMAALAMVLAGAACAPVTPPTAAQAGAAVPGATNPPACQTTIVPVTVGGRLEQATVEACPQPDGSWRITQRTPGLPPQVYLMRSQPADVYPPEDVYPDIYSAYDDYFDYWPYWAGGGAWFCGIGPTVVIVQHFRHFGHPPSRGAGGFHGGMGGGFRGGGGRR